MAKTKEELKSIAERWGEFRFSVIGHLLSAPPCPKELKKVLSDLSAKTWRHPITGQPARFGKSTIERWYYAARKEPRSPVKRLMRQVRSDSGKFRKVTQETAELLNAQYRQHQSWSKKLHSDNLRVAIGESELAPSYATIARYMNQKGLTRRAHSNAANRAGQRAALLRLDSYEVRSFESDHVGALFHLDFHHCSRQILEPGKNWVTPIALAVIDDCSRIICHLQWYLGEKTEDLVHGVIQAFLKMGLPRALMSDNGAAMTSHEFVQGLAKLSIIHSTTLPYSPYQNGKQERFFGSLEGRLLALCENISDLSLAKLNYATQAWLEMEYTRSIHRELGTSPAQKLLNTKSVLRPAPSFDELRMAFRHRIVRRQRRTDNTISIEGTRFEIPAAYRTLKDIVAEYASWDLSLVHLVDPKSGSPLCRLFPINKSANANSERRRLNAPPDNNTNLSSEEPELLKKLLEDFAATGLPAAFIPKRK